MQLRCSYVAAVMALFPALVIFRNWYSCTSSELCFSAKIRASKIKSYIESGPTLLDDDTNIAIKIKIAEIEKLTGEVNRLLAVD